MSVIAYILRHGTTKHNADGKFRSWLDVPLDKTGIQEAKDAAEWLSDKPIKYVVSSDLDRAHHTAHIVAAHHGIKPEINRDLRPWHLGDLAGKDKKENEGVLRAMIKDRDKMPPGEGESLNQFGKRNGTTIKHLLEAAKKDPCHLIICHTSNITDLIDAIPTEAEEFVGPGGIIEVDENYKMKDVFGGDK
jgi:broad specificity phosphatase PhoE